MSVDFDEMKQYLRVDYDDDDTLILHLISSAEKLCLDVLRTDDKTVLEKDSNCKTAILYAVEYLYERREEADYNKLILSLRSLLFGSRREEF